MEKLFRNAPIMAKNDEVRRGLWDLARAHRMLDTEGHNDFAWGHGSMRDPWGRGVWLKRANLGLEEVFEEDFILIDFDGNVLGGDGIRHLEWPIHTEILRARPDFNFVLHTHAPWSTLFSACTQETLRPYTNEGCWFTVPPPHYMTTSDLIDTAELGKDMAKVMGRSEGVFLRNHGICVGGVTVKDMLLAAIFLEKACRNQLQLAMSGLKHTYPDKKEVDKKRKTIFPQRARDNCWDYMNRRLDRIEDTVGAKRGEYQ
jgi:ribulose-5-phosphate 4-epimerase/fuculose-1-phosphate aldolase